MIFLRPSCVFLLGVLSSTLLSPAMIEVGWAATEILDVTLAHDVKDREPAAPYAPQAFCEKDQNRNGVLPRIQTSDQQIVFWNRIAASDSTKIRHSWHKRADDGWKLMAHVDLPILKSSSFRIWSTKDLHPTFHRGEWMIVVTLSDDPKKVLCITRFIVE